MNTDEVVMHEVDRHRVRMVLRLLAERVGESRELARSHPNGQVSPFCVAGADVLRIGAALDPFLL